MSIVKGYGKIRFDNMDYDANDLELYAIAICDPDTGLTVKEERYTDEEGYRIALRDTYGRELVDEQTVLGSALVLCDGHEYEADATYRVAYVVDSED